MAAPATRTPGADAETSAPLATTLDLGGRRYDLTHRALVMGILNRTPDSFYDKGATFELDKLYARAEQLVADGADILDIGGVKAGPGPEVSEAEELERVVPGRRRPGRALRGARLGRHLARLGGPRLVRRGRRDGQRHQRPGRPGLRGGRRRARCGRGRDPHPPRPACGRSRSALRRRRARRGPLPLDRAALRPGGRRPRRTHRARRRPRPGQDGGAVRDPACVRRRPWPLSATRSCSPRPTRRSSARSSIWSSPSGATASIGAAALGIAWGCRIVRVHDVKGTCRVRDALAAVSEAE